MDRGAERVSRHALALVGALGVIIAEVSTAALWGTTAAGWPVLVADAVLLGALAMGLLAGRGLESAARQVGATGPPGRFEALVALVGAVGLVIGVGSAWLALRQATSPLGVAPGLGPCGSRLVPRVGSCTPSTGTASVLATAALAVVLGGLVFAYLANSDRAGPSVAARLWPKYAFWGAGALLVAALVVVPRSAGPVMQGPSAPGEPVSPSVLASAGGELRLAVGLLAAALALLAVIGLSGGRKDGRVPLLACMVALAIAAVAGIAVGVVWLGVIVP